MKYIHIRNLEKYNPGYIDRNLIWCKIYFTMLNSNYEFELIDDIDKWRLIALIMLELQIKKPIPYDDKWLQKKISNNKRSMSLTLKMLHNFLEVVTEDGKACTVDKNRIDKNRIDKNRIDNIPPFAFDSLWKKYPKRIDKKKALTYFKQQIKTEKDYEAITQALDNYLKSERVIKGFIKDGFRWFRDWRQWEDYTEDVCPKCKGRGTYTSSNGYINACDCPAGKK